MSGILFFIFASCHPLTEQHCTTRNDTKLTLQYINVRHQLIYHFGNKCVFRFDFLVARL